MAKKKRKCQIVKPEAFFLIGANYISSNLVSIRLAGCIISSKSIFQNTLTKMNLNAKMYKTNDHKCHGVLKLN